jgi:hypothetical protein
MAKRKFKSWAFAEEAYAHETKSAGLLQMALSDVLAGKVDWVSEEGGLKVGVSRLDAPHGGIVVLLEDGIASAQYVDDWASWIGRRPMPSFSDPERTAIWDRDQRFAAEVRRRQNTVHERLMAEARR